MCWCGSTCAQRFTKAQTIKQRIETNEILLGRHLAITVVCQNACLEAGKKVQLVKSLSCKPENLSWIPSHQVQELGVAAEARDPGAGEAEMEISRACSLISKKTRWLVCEE